MNWEVNWMAELGSGKFGSGMCGSGMTELGSRMSEWEVG